VDSAEIEAGEDGKEKRKEGGLRTNHSGSEMTRKRKKGGGGGGGTAKQKKKKQSRQMKRF